MSAYKVCTKCKKPKEVSDKDFHRHRNASDGFCQVCKECRYTRGSYAKA